MLHVIADAFSHQSYDVDSYSVEWFIPDITSVTPLPDADVNYKYRKLEISSDRLKDKPVNVRGHDRWQLSETGGIAL